MTTKIMTTSIKPLCGAIALSFVASTAIAKPVTWNDIKNDANTPEDVLGYGIGPKAQRWSNLTGANLQFSRLSAAQFINANMQAANLVIAWI